MIEAALPDHNNATCVAEVVQLVHNNATTYNASFISDLKSPEANMWWESAKQLPGHACTDGNDLVGLANSLCRVTVKN